MKESKNKNEHKHKPFHLSTFTLREDGKWRLRRAKYRGPSNRSTGRCWVAFCRRRRRADGRSRLCHTCESREWRANHPMRAAYLRLKSHATQRRILFDLTYEQFELFVTGPNGLGYMDRKGNRSRLDLQIDRIRNREGYTLSNLQVLTLSENTSKRYWEDEPRNESLPF